MDIRIQEHRDQPETVILSILEFVEEDQVFISALSQSKNFLFAQAIKDTLYRIICLYPFWEKQAYLRYDLLADFAREVYIASIESVISHWIATDFQQPPQELAQMISGLALADSPPKKPVSFFLQVFFLFHYCQSCFIVWVFVDIFKVFGINNLVVRIQYQHCTCQ